MFRPVRVLVLAALLLIQLGPSGLQAAADTSPHWFAFHTKTLDARTADDSIDASPRTLVQNWRLHIARPFGDTAWDAALTVMTPLAPADLSWNPAMSYDAATMTFSRAATTLAMFTQAFGNPAVTNELTSLGFSASRVLGGGRSIAAGATVTKILDITVTPTVVMRSIVIAPSFTDSPGPVTVLSSDCPGTAFGQWQIVDPPPGTVITRSCTLTLRNDSAAAASYMPGVHVASSEGVQNVTSTGGTSFVVSDALGMTTLAVTPPAAVAPVAHLDQWIEKRVSLASENVSAAAPTQDWTAWLFRNYSVHTPADSVANGVALVPSWGMVISAFDTPTPFPATIQLTTTLAESQLIRFPSVAPEPVAGGLRYTWTGLTPFFQSDVLGNGITIDAPLGFSGDRSLSGGRLVPAHSSGPRTLTVHTTTTDPMIGLSIAAEFGPPPAFPLVISEIDCLGSSPVGGSPNGRAWRLDSPAPGTAATFTCTFTLANTGDADLLYMPWVNLWSDRSQTGTSPVLGASTRQISTPLLGTIDYSVEVPAGTDPVANTAEIDIRIATLEMDARIAPRSTTLQILTTGTYAFGFVPPLEARLADSAGAPVAGKTVRLELQNAASATLFSADAITDAAGIARATLPLTLLPGSYTVRASFAGDATYLASADARPLTVVNSTGRVLGSFRLASGARGVLAVRSSASGLTGDFDFVTASRTYHATAILALGLAGNRAVVLTADAAGVRALVTVDDNGAPGTLDRISIVIDGNEQNPTGMIAAGNLQILP